MSLSDEQWQFYLYSKRQQRPENSEERQDGDGAESNAGDM